VQWVMVIQEVSCSDHVSINRLQNLMSLLRNKKEISNIPITIRLSVMPQPSVSVS